MINKQIKSFILTGVLNTIVYYVLFSIFIYFGLDYKFAVLFATMIGVVFSFKTFSKYVFENDNNMLIFRFIAVYIILYFSNIFIINKLNIWIENYYISGFIATICCAILSFGLNKYFVFNNKER